MSEIKLLPCPFCGEKAKMRRRIVKGRNMFYVTCENEFGCVISATHLCDTEEEATRRWNTRKPTKRILKRLQCKEVLENVASVENSKEESLLKGYVLGVKKAIEMIKEEGTINEDT